MNSKQRRKQKREFPFSIKPTKWTFEKHTKIMEWRKNGMVGEGRQRSDTYMFNDERDAIMFSLLFAEH